MMAIEYVPSGASAVSFQASCSRSAGIGPSGSSRRVRRLGASSSTRAA
ncbi:MAG: hypothetical protein ABSC13_05140 [Dehalococcoidia bacterium]